MECLQTRSQQLLRVSVSVNTASTYKNAISCFDDFRIQYGLGLNYPGRADHIVLFISYCFEKGFSPATIKTYISGLSFYHKLNNWYNPADLFVVKKLLEGCCRSRMRVDNRAPITPLILRSICASLSSVCYNDYEATMFKAAYLLTYYGLLRVSEVVHSTWQHYGRALQVQDVTFDKSGNSVFITIRRSKTYQVGPSTYFRIPCESDATVCPVCALKCYVASRSGAPGYFFKHQNNRPLTRAQFSAVLAKCISASPFRGQHILSHSFRIGRASELASNGVSDEAIMKLGRWRSSSFRTYIRN